MEYEMKLKEGVSFPALLFQSVISFYVILGLIVIVDLIIVGFRGPSRSIFIISAVIFLFLCLGMFPASLIAAFKDRNNYIFYKDHLIVTSGQGTKYFTGHGFITQANYVVYYKDIQKIVERNDFSQLMRFKKRYKAYGKNFFSSKFDHRLLLIDLKKDHRVIYKGDILTKKHLDKHVNPINFPRSYGRYVALSRSTIQQYIDKGHRFP